MTYSRLLATLFAATLPALSLAEEFVLAFGSCVHQDKPQPIWNEIRREKPDVFVFLGDNIYGDTDDMSVLAAKYQQLGAKPGLQALREETEIQATWDDHDYGRNDAGAEYPHKEASRRIMLDFFEVPINHPRRSQPHGIYTAKVYSVGDHKVQLILLDLRWNRSSLAQVTKLTERLERYRLDMGPYLVSQGDDATLMGDQQWQWLNSQLEEEADVTIIGSSIQVLAEFTGWESWANFPTERQRVLDLAADASRPVLFISGDVHWAELSQVNHRERQIYELTSSGLTEEWQAISPNRHRVGKAYAVANFGMLRIDFTGEQPSLGMSVRDSAGKPIIESELMLLQ